MKLLVVVPALGSIYGGPSKSVVELAQALGRSSISVDIVTTNANGDSIVDRPVKQWLLRDSYRVKYFPYVGVADYKLSGSLASWLFQHVRDYDMVQTNAIFSVTNLPAYLACRQYGIPYVVIPRGMLEPWALSYKAWKKKVYYKLFEQPALQRASAIQMLASTEAQQIEPLNLKSPLVISPNGIHRQDFERMPSPDLFFQIFPETRGKQLILFLGRIDPKKGLNILAQAFGQISAEFSEAHLVVAGPDNIGFLPTAKAYFAESNCSSSVTFTGILTGELKYSALAAASHYVAPSYSEGFSMSVLEGMASGLACVITTGCNFPEAAQADVARVVEIDTSAIVNALRLSLSNPEAAADMGVRAREFIFENYTWDRIAQNLSDVYQAILTQQSLTQHA